MEPEELFGDDPDKVEDEEAPASEEGEPEVRFGYDPDVGMAHGPSAGMSLAWTRLSF